MSSKIHINSMTTSTSESFSPSSLLDESSKEKSFDDSSISNIIGTHPNEIKTSVNPDNGYPVRQENGQRKTGPPPDWPTTRHPPGRGCEVFVGKLPRDCFEEELFPLFERCGQIYEMRLMLDFSGFNRGYTFITFTNRDDAKRCVKDMNNYEIRPNHGIGVCQSVDNCRLFVGGIPKTKKREEILDQMCQITEGVVDVIVYPSTNDKTKNRGFAFVEYESHRSAAMARRKLLPGNIQLWGQQIAVDWAEPENQVDEDVMANVRILYVRNLMMNTTEEQIREAFEQFKPNSIERVKKLKDYAFVHFKERTDALHAMNMINGTELDGSIIEVTLAKPVDRNQYFRFTRGVSPSALTSNLPFALSTTGGLSPATSFDLRAFPYLSIPTTSNTPIQMSNGTTIIPMAMNPLQPKNIRRCVNATGRLPSNGNTSPPSLTRHPATGLLSSSSRPNPAGPTIAHHHHRGPYYTIIRPTSRRTDEKCLEDLSRETYEALYSSAAHYTAPSMTMMIDANQSHFTPLPDQHLYQHTALDEIPFVPTAFGFHPGTQFFQPTAVLPHPYLSGQSFHPQPFFFATAASPSENGQQSQHYYHHPAHPQANFAFPFLLTPPVPSAHSTTSDNSDSSVLTYPLVTTTTTSLSSTTSAAAAAASTDSSSYSG